MDIQATKTDISLMLGAAERAGAKFHKAGRGYASCCPIHGGDNPTAFNVWSGADGVALYRCWTRSECGSGDIFTLTMRLNNCDFITAKKILNCESSAPILPRPIPQPKPIRIPADDFQAGALAEMDATFETLLHKQEGRLARDFLLRRGIASDMWKLYKLGSGDAWDSVVKRNRPAIVIPYRDCDASGEEITAVKYRFIDHDPNPNAQRYTSRKGSAFDLPFGLFDAHPRPLQLPVLQHTPLDLIPTWSAYHHSLVFFEGEFNAISARQCNPRGVSVLSVGSEGSGDLRVLNKIADRFENVYLWFDDIWDKPQNAQRAKELLKLVRGRGVDLRSEHAANGIKLDANKLLQVGKLADFLTGVLGLECEGYA